MRRPSPYAARFTTNHIEIWEICALIGAAPKFYVCSYSYGGDCAAIEQNMFGIPFGIRLQI